MLLATTPPALNTPMLFLPFKTIILEFEPFGIFLNIGIIVFKSNVCAEKLAFFTTTLLINHFLSPHQASLKNLQPEFEDNLKPNPY